MNGGQHLNFTMWRVQVESKWAAGRRVTLPKDSCNGSCKGVFGGDKPRVISKR